LTVLTYSILLTSEVGKYFIFDFHNNVLFWVLLLPYLTFLTLVPLTTTYLTNNFSFAKAFKLTSIIISVGISPFQLPTDLTRTIQTTFL